MLQKKIIEEPIFKNVQVGVDKREVWVTSDGLEYRDEDSAERHDFYYCKLKMKHSLMGATLLDLQCIDDLERYLDDYVYNVDIHDYDKSILSFPNTYVLIEHDDCDEYDYPETTLKIYTVEEFKKLVMDELDEIESI